MAVVDKKTMAPDGITTTQRMLSSCTGAVITSLIGEDSISLLGNNQICVTISIRPKLSSRIKAHRGQVPVNICS